MTYNLRHLAALAFSFLGLESEGTGLGGLPCSVISCLVGTQMGPGHGKSRVFAPSGAFCREKLMAVMEEASLRRDENLTCLGKLVSFSQPVLVQ